MLLFLCFDSDLVSCGAQWVWIVAVCLKMESVISVLSLLWLLVSEQLWSSLQPDVYIQPSGQRGDVVLH